MRWRRLPVLFLVLAVSACADLGPPQDQMELRRLRFSELSGWPQERHSEALETFLASCDRVAKKGTTTGRIAISTAQWAQLCAAARAATAMRNDASARAFFEEHFVPMRVSNRGKEEGLFTGYYEPVLYGSRTKQGAFQYPLYARPPELVTGEPYLTRAQIQAGALSGRGLEFLWVDDPVMLFFMQVQGSGRVRLPEGTELRIGFAGKNERPFIPIGKVMAERNLLPRDKVNFFSIRQWLYDHPDRALEVMNENPSFVFFKELKGAGPVGSSGAVLTARRSMAVDPRFIPYGLPLYLEVPMPDAAGNAGTPMRRLMIAQDTGTAIRGPVRGDIFYGAGVAAEKDAGYMRFRGNYTLLLPRAVSAGW